MIKPSRPGHANPMDRPWLQWMSWALVQLYWGGYDMKEITKLNKNLKITLYLQENRSSRKKEDITLNFYFKIQITILEKTCVSIGGEKQIKNIICNFYITQFISMTNLILFSVIQN